MNWETFKQIVTDPVTGAILILLVALFAYYLRKVWQVYVCNKNLRKAASGGRILEQLKQMPSIRLIAKNYEHSICFKDDAGKTRTSDFASDYFNLGEVLSAKRINRQAMGSAAGILVGIGVLGTFVGLSLAVAKIKMGNEVNIDYMWSSINTLLDGMKIAFVTSVAGMMLSSIYTIVEKHFLNCLTKTCAQISDLLDDQYYISDLEKQNIETERRNEMFLKQIGTIVHDIKSIDDDANELTIGNMLRDIKQCNENQVNAINSVAEEICNGLGEKFDEVADKMVNAIQNPQGGLAGGVVEQLQSAIDEMLVKLKENLEKGTTQKMEELGSQLQLASESLKQLPLVMADLSSQMRTDLNQIEERISAMNDSSAQVGVNLAEKQSALNAQTEKLVNDFDAGMKKSVEMIDAFSATLQQFASIQSQNTQYAENMKHASTTVKSAVENLTSAQSGFVKDTNETFKEIKYSNEITAAMTKNTFEEVRGTVQKTFESTDALIKESEELAKTYTDEFEKVRLGMGSVFEQVNKGLEGYTEAVKTNTGNLFAAYTKEMNKALENLHAIVTQLCLANQPNKK